MFLTICQACHKGRKLSANNGQENIIFKNLTETIPAKFDLGKNQTTIGKHSYHILVTIPYSILNYQAYM